MQFTSTTQLSQSHIQSYAWDLGNGKTSTVANPSICYPKSGVYSIDVTAVSDKGCVSHDTIRNMITVYSHPVANFYYNPQTITILDPMVEFTSTSTPSGDSLLWYSFGDGLGSTSTKQNPVHIYQDTGTYCVNLIATNANNCKDTTQQCIIVKPYFTMYVPNAFSPNNDGINDNFYAVAEYIKDFDMKIFDRWGNVVFHSTDINNQWTGTKHQEDVYIVLIDVTDTHNKPHTYHGTVTLIK